MILMFCNVGFAGWKNFTPDDKEGVYTYFDTTSIKKSGEYTQVWTLTDYPYPDSEGNHSNKVLFNFNCTLASENNKSKSSGFSCLACLIYFTACSLSPLLI